MNLPTISFSLTGIQYDPLRKQQSQLQSFVKNQSNPSGIYTQYIGVPYNLNFQLSFFVRNIEDGLQIVEQILPWFTPDYTLTMDFVDQMNITKSVPIILNDVRWENDYEGDAKEKMRSVIWTLDFTMQSYFFGPTYTGGIIKQATSNISFYATVDDDETLLQIGLANSGLLSYQTGETVYQGSSLPNANAIGHVVSFSGNTLVITNTQGAFKPNANIHGALTGASWNVVTTPNNTVLASIVVTPNPANAVIGDDFGFTTVIKETPNI